MTQVCNATGSAWITVETCAHACTAGLCTGACEPGAQRCSGTTAERCAASGASWEHVESCPSYCHVGTGQCALVGKLVTGNENYDGVLVVDGALVVKAGASLYSPAGELTIYADSIVVEVGGSIGVAATGTTFAGQGAENTGCSTTYRVGGGGSYGTQGTAGYSGCGRAGQIHGQTQDSRITKGSRGGSNSTNTDWGLGGGALRLIAPSIEVRGSLNARGASAVAGTRGGGGSGGGILLAADDLTVTGALDTTPGVGGTATYNGGNGGHGRIKLLYGVRFEDSGTYTNGVVTRGMLSPLDVGSSTAPLETLHYNDDFDEAHFSWSEAFPSVLGYYVLTNTTATTVPTPANASWVAAETIAVPRSAFVAGANFFHVASVDSSSLVSTVQSWFQVNLNTTPPTVSSPSHPSQSAWYAANRDAFFSWTLPTPDASVTGYYWHRDQFADTVPTKSHPFLAVGSKQLLQAGLPDGVHFFHVVSMDKNGHLTKQAGHYQVRIGASPGAGDLLGNVYSPAATPIANAKVEINRGLATATTNASGAFSFVGAIAGTWELRVSAPGYQPSAVTVTVTDGGATLRDITLTP